MPSIRILAPVGEEYTFTLPVVMVSVADIVGFTVVTTVVVWVTATVVFTGGAVVTVVAAVVADGVTFVGCVTMVVADGVTLAGCVTTVVCDVVTLSALTGSIIRSIARNTATGMTDDPLPRDIDKLPPAGFTGNFL
jgi:hypothetical protein